MNHGLPPIGCPHWYGVRAAGSKCLRPADWRIATPCAPRAGVHRVRLGSGYADSGHRCHRLRGITPGHRAAGEPAPGGGRHPKPGAPQAFRLVRRRRTGQIGRVDPASARAAFAGAGPVDVVVLPGARDRSARTSATPTRTAAPTSRPRPATPGCDASSTWVASCPRTSLSEHLTSRAEVAEALTVHGRSGAGVAGRGDHHRRGLDVVRDDALRRRPLPAHADPELDGQPDRPDLHPRRAALSRRRGRPPTWCPPARTT